MVWILAILGKLVSTWTHEANSPDYGFPSPNPHWGLHPYTKHEQCAGRLPALSPSAPVSAPLSVSLQHEKKNKIKLASPAFKQTLVCIQGDGKGLQSEIYKRTWILDKKTPNKSEKRISPNKSKVALKLNPFWLILYTRKKTMLDWHPPPPNSHPVAYRTVADCQWYFSSEMADWIFIYFY